MLYPKAKVLALGPLYIRSYSKTKETIRNVAIIAHVDHGKTTLVDCLLRHSGSLIGDINCNRVMDSNILEKERGITILSKCTSINHKDFRINIVDTPGHADFGGEVERALTMVDGVVLVVDASEGPMAQTKFVLSKALQKNLIPIVVQNKVDRESARCDDVDCELLDMFLTLNASNEQLDFPIVYASAKNNWAFSFNPLKRKDLFPNIQDIKGDMNLLFDLIVSKIPPPNVNEDKPFSLLVNSVDTNAFVGKCVLGKIESGRLKLGDRIKAMAADGSLVEENRVTKMFLKSGMMVNEIVEAHAGEIISIAGLNQARVNHTISDLDVSKPLEIIPVDPPTVGMTFRVNDSPYKGSEGKCMTRTTLYQRLQRECENNISLKLSETEDINAFEVFGRGELQLGILIETIRREGFEIAVSPPRVLTKKESDGTLMEPIEDVTIDCEIEYSGEIIEKLSKRKAVLTKMLDAQEGRCKMEFKCPTRGLIGFVPEMKNFTKGTAVLTHIFSGYEAFKGTVESSRKGCLISMTQGTTTTHALSDLESRGTLFIGPGTRVYSGMVIGECSRSLDIEVNPCREKILTNIRTICKEEFSRLVPPRQIPLEEMIAYMADDEMIEVTPISIRLRKCDLDASARRRRSQAKKAA